MLLLLSVLSLGKLAAYRVYRHVLRYHCTSPHQVQAGIVASGDTVDPVLHAWYRTRCTDGRATDDGRTFRRKQMCWSRSVRRSSVGAVAVARGKLPYGQAQGDFGMLTARRTINTDNDKSRSETF